MKHIEIILQVYLTLIAYCKDLLQVDNFLRKKGKKEKVVSCIVLILKYTNPARGILDFCKQKFFGPSNASNKPYTACTPCFELCSVHHKAVIHT